jgi:hypothetical protein
MADLGRLLLLQFPVRCRSCLQRSFVSLLEARKLRGGRRRRRVEASEQPRRDDSFG